MSTEELALAIQQMSVIPKNRTRMNRTAAGSELRKAGNSLAKYLDGQKELPSSPNERNQIRAAFAEILSELQQDPQYADLTMADLQAALWYAERRLYETSKDSLSDGTTDGYEDTEAPDYANAAVAVAVAKANGIKDSRIQRALEREEDGRPRAARPTDEAQEAPVEGQPEEGGGFARGKLKQFLGGLATLNARSNRGGGGTLWGYSRRTRKRRGGDGLLEWVPGKGLRRVYKSAGVVTPTFVELESTPENASRFAEAVEASKAASKYGAAVHLYPAEDYQGMRLILSESGQSGVAIKPDGDIVSLFSSEGSGRSVVEVAIAAGGTRADAFDTVLAHLYSAHGLKVVSRPVPGPLPLAPSI